MAVRATLTYGIALTALVTVSGCTSSSTSTVRTPTAASIAGEWESLSCEVRPQKGKDGVQSWYLKRKLRLTGAEIEAEFMTYGDPGCKTPTMKLELGGRYSVVSDSNVVAGAKQADLTIDRYTRITPLADGFAGFLNSAGPGKCGTDTWLVGKAQEIKATGCTLLGVAPNVDVKEFEVLYVRDDLLFFAARPVDGSSPDSAEKRPTTLQIPLLRVPRRAD